MGAKRKHHIHFRTPCSFSGTLATQRNTRPVSIWLREAEDESGDSVEEDVKVRNLAIGYLDENKPSTYQKHGTHTL